MGLSGNLTINWLPKFQFFCRCATNADFRLADWQVNEVNIVVKCSNRFPIPKLDRFLEDLKFRDRESVKAFHNNVYLIYLPVCKCAVCVCHTLFFCYSLGYPLGYSTPVP